MNRYRFEEIRTRGYEVDLDELKAAFPYEYGDFLADHTNADDEDFLKEVVAELLDYDPKGLLRQLEDDTEVNFEWA